MRKSLEDLGAVESPKSKVKGPKSEESVQYSVFSVQKAGDGTASNPAAQATRNTQHGTRITELGRKMLAFPLHPRYARMLLAAQDHGCVYQACLVAALTQGRDLLLRNVDKHTASNREDLLGEKASSDFWILMRAYTYASKNDFSLSACPAVGHPCGDRTTGRPAIPAVFGNRPERKARGHASRSAG